MGRPVVHWEMWSKDPEKLSKFYEKLFGWQTQFVPEMSYHMVNTGGEGGINGGMMKPDEDGPWPGNTAIYIHVEKLETYVEAIKKAGGKIHVERMPVGDMGALALFEDPDGRVVGLWEMKAAAEC